MPKFEATPPSRQEQLKALDKLDTMVKRSDAKQTTEARVALQTEQRKDEREAKARMAERRGKLETNVLKDLQSLFDDNEMQSINEAVDELQEAGSGPDHDRAVDALESVAKKLQEAFGEEGEDKFNIWAKGAGVNQEDREGVSLGVFQLKESA